MKFEKDGKVYDDIDALLHETCFAGTRDHCGSCKIKAKAITEQDSCYAYAIKHQREIAQYLGYEAIEDDTPTVAEVVEKHGEDASDTEKGVIMNNERKMSILLNAIGQMACDAEDKGKIDFGLRLTVEDAYALCHAASHTDNTPDVVEKYGEDVKRKLTRADILHAAEKCVCGQRETDYGAPEDNFKAIAELWNVYLDQISVGKYGNTIVDEKDVAVMMALLKIARIARGGGKADSWIDLAGYAACGAECEGVTE